MPSKETRTCSGCSHYKSVYQGNVWMKNVCGINENNEHFQKTPEQCPNWVKWSTTYNKESKPYQHSDKYGACYIHD